MSNLQSSGITSEPYFFAEVGVRLRAIRFLLRLFAFGGPNTIHSLVTAAGFLLALLSQAFSWTRASLTRSTGISEPQAARKPSTRVATLAILEFVAGGVVVVGGSALVAFSADQTGKALGIAHLVLGFIAFPAGYLLWTGKPRAWTITLAVNLAITHDPTDT